MYRTEGVIERRSSTQLDNMETVSD